MSTVSALPPPPDPSDTRSVFNAKAFAFWAAMPAFQAEINVVVGEINVSTAAASGYAATATTKAAEAYAAQVASAANAAAAAASAGAAPWAAGSYSAGTPARSTIDYRIYVARTTGSKPTDPASDPTNWGLASGNGLQLVVGSGASSTAASGGRYALKNAAQSSLTAPPTPQAGDIFGVKVANGRSDNLINWNGAKHEGISDSTMTLNSSSFARDFVYIDASYGWGLL